MDEPLPDPGSGAARAAVTWLRWAPLLVVAAAWLAYAPVRTHGWVLDDTALVRDSAAVGRGPAAIPDLLAAGAPQGMEDGSYGPLTRVSFALEAPLWRRADGTLPPDGFHLMNLLLHGLCALLLYRFLLLLLPARPLVALGGALVFAAHPAQAAAVAPLMGRSVLLAATFCLLAGVVWRGWDGRLSWRPFLALLAWFLALMSHESALGLPIVLAVLDRACPRPGARERPLQARAGWLLFALPLAAFLVLWQGPATLGPDVPAQGAGARLLVGLEGLVRLALSYVVPVGLRGDHSDEIVPGVGYPLGAATLACAAVVVLLTAWLLWRARRGRAGAFTVLWLCAVALAVPAALALPPGRPLETRWGYVVGLALLPAAGLLLDGLRRRGRLSEFGARLRTALVAGLAVICLIGLSLREAQAWQDDQVFQEHLLERNPGHLEAMVRLARSERRAAQTLRMRAAGLRTDDPQHAALLRQRGEALRHAAQWARRAVTHARGRSSPAAWRELGLVYLASDRSAEALRALERARGLDPLLLHPAKEVKANWSAARLRAAGELYFAIGRAREALGNRETAADAFVTACVFEPGRADYRERAGHALCRVNRYAEGLAMLQQALRETHDARGRARLEAAIDGARKSARRIAADLVRRGLEARDLHATSGKREAVTLFEQALAVDPTSVEALIEAGHLRGWWFGNYELADAYFQRAEELLDRAGAPPDDERRQRIRRLRAEQAKQKAAEDAEAGGRGSDGEKKDR
jgi:tetratricopeptide (TPR) repeat protein